MDIFTFMLYLVIFALNAFSGVLPVKIPAALLVIIAGLAGLAASLFKNRKAAARKEGDA